MHCWGLDYEFQLAKVHVQDLGGTPNGDFLPPYHFVKLRLVMSPSIWVDKKDLVGWSTARSYQKKYILYVGTGNCRRWNHNNFKPTKFQLPGGGMTNVGSSFGGLLVARYCPSYFFGLLPPLLGFSIHRPAFCNIQQRCGTPSTAANLHAEIMMLCTVKHWPSPASMPSPLPGKCRGANKCEKLIGIHDAYWKTSFSLSPNNLLFKIGHCHWFISIIKGTQFLPCAKSWAAKYHSRPSFPVRLSLFVAPPPQV